MEGIDQPSLFSGTTLKGVRVLCALEYSDETIDHTNIEVFRNQPGNKGVEAINQIVVKTASKAGFTGSGLCSSDTTVQESPIAYPTEVGHMRNIATKLVGIGMKIKKKLSGRLEKPAGEVQHTFTKIRLFTRGKEEKAVAQKKKLSQELHRTVSRRTGFHRPGKIISLWERQARAITRNKAAKAVEFGRRRIITRLEKGYIIGTPCRKWGGDADTSIMPEVPEHFERMMGEKPKMAVYDRGGDGPKNHETLPQKEIRNAIFRKGKESLVGLGRNTSLKARRERALSEAAIATIKHSRYGFNRPGAKSSEGCLLKGQAAIPGANLTRLARDWTQAAVMA